MIKVNLTTKETTNETLPKFLKGLKQESLNDLSWTDEALGVQGYGYWQEQDVSVQPTESQKFDGTVAYTLDGANYIVKVTRGIIDKTQEDLDAELLEYQESLKLDMEAKIQSYINTIVKAKGYDDENSIAKYLIEGNPFYEECKAISLWIGNVWLVAITIMTDVSNGSREVPEDIIIELPELV